MISEAFRAFNAIGDTSSRNEKEEIVANNIENPVFSELLYICYNPFIRTNFKRTVGVPTVSVDPPASDMYQDFIFLIHNLSKREYTGNVALEAVTRFFKHCTEQEYKWYSRVMLKDMKIGITEKTINKVKKGFIPEYSCSLAASKFVKLPKCFRVDVKLDGYRCNAFHYENGTVELLSRNGITIEGYTDIEEAIKTLPRGYMYDGEIMGRKGTFNEVQKSAFKKSKDKDGVLHVFDCVSIPDFEAKKGTVPYRARLKFLDDMADYFESSANMNLVTGHKFCGGHTEENLAKVYELHAQFTAQGYEGTMVKDLDAVYECKRSKNIQKIKDMETLDLVIVGVEEGKKGTEFEGTLGALVVGYENNTVNVGSGYSKALRDELWAKRNELVDKVIEVKYQEKTVNEKGKSSLRFPIFMKFRPDK